MKRFRFYAILIAIVAFVACSEDFEPRLITDLETDTFVFDSEGGEQSFILESNEEWFLDEFPDWLSVEVVDAPATRAASYEKGTKAVTITVNENPKFEERSTELVMMSVSGKTVVLKVTQEKRSGFAGYWILSEGTSGQGDAELAWVDYSGELKTKQFQVLNDKKLGDTANELKLYGSKMYAVITGQGFTAETTKEDSYIEVINPVDGKSIKRIPFTNAEGIAAKPRNIVFEGDHAYISSYSNEVVRLDTATLTLDKHTPLSGEWAEGLTYNSGNIYVCNSGRGGVFNISVIDTETMVETKTITTANNPSKIVTASNGDIYFTTDWPGYKLYKLTVANDKIAEMPGLSVADITYNKSDNNIYTSYFDWDNFAGELNKFDVATSTATKFNLELGSPVYHIGVINGSNLLYLTGQMGNDVVIFDPATKEIKHALDTGVPGGSGVVAVYR